MRRVALMCLMLIGLAASAPTAAKAAIFDGREGWQFQGGLKLDWSTDLGNPPAPVYYPPYPGTVADVTVSNSDSTFISGGRVGATLTHHIAPLGPLSPSTPLCTYDLHTWASNPGSYGRFVSALDNGNFYLEPAVMGESLSVVVHWKVTASGPPGSWSWNEQCGGVLADQSSGTEGYAVKILQGPDLRYYVFRSTFMGGGGVSASVVGTEDMVLHVEIFASDTRVLGVPQSRLPAGLVLSAPAPNPVRDAAMFSVDVAQRSAADLAITDVTGRVVRTLALGTLEAGRHAVRWDRRDDRGASVAPGIYWARVKQADGRAAGQRVVVLD
jgi:hypothetical protein